MAVPEGLELPPPPKPLSIAEKIGVLSIFAIMLGIILALFWAGHRAYWESQWTANKLCLLAVMLTALLPLAAAELG